MLFNFSSKFSVSLFLSSHFCGNFFRRKILKHELHSNSEISFNNSRNDMKSENQFYLPRRSITQQPESSSALSWAWRREKRKTEKEKEKKSENFNFNLR